MSPEHPQVPPDCEPDPQVTDPPEGADPPPQSRVVVAAAILIAALAAALGIGQMSHYGVTTDSPSLFYAGDRTLFWILNPDVPGALDFRGTEPPGFETSFERHPEWQDPLHVPVLAGLLAAITSKVFHETLGWVDVVDGHHLALVMLHALTLLLFCLYASRLLGPGAGISATVILALFPSAVGHSFNNAKDWPCVQFYGLAVLAAGVGIVEARARHLLVAAVFVGLALSGKLNGVFVFPTILLWTPVAFLLLYRGQRQVPARVVGAYLVAPYIVGAVFFALWPWLYYGRVPDWWRHIHWYMVFLLDYGVGDRPTWTAHSVQCLAFMTPPIVLMLALIYALWGWRGSRRSAAVHSLLLVWLLVPLVRIAAPHSHFYDANRHFLEYVPALCAMAGGGVALAARWLRKRWRGPRSRWALPAVAAFGLAALVWPVVQYHPYETTYFNVFVGGLGGAQRRALFLSGPSSVRLNGTEGDYWYSSLRAGLRDIEASFPAGGTVGFCGPRPPLGRANLRAGSALRILEGDESAVVADFVYASPRPRVCGWNDVRDLEVARPVLRRVERGGGLIYQVFGPADGRSRPPTTGPTAYDAVPGPEYDDRASAVSTGEP